MITKTYQCQLAKKSKLVKDTKFKEGDIVLARSCAGPAIPATKVRLLEKITTCEMRGNNFDCPGYICWRDALVCEKEVKMLRKRFQIPYSWPEDVETYVFDQDIIKKVIRKKKPVTRRRRPRACAQRDQAKNRKS